MSTQNSPLKRASRYKRLSKPPSMNLTDRDKEVVKTINDFRVMRQDHIQRLFFPSKNTAQVRLWKLWQHGFLKREFLPVLGGIQNSPILYLVDKQGVDFLQTELEYRKEDLRWTPGSLGQQFIRHTLGLSEIRLSVEVACKKHGYTLLSWQDEKAMKDGPDHITVGRRLEPILPDAYFVVGIPNGRVHFFLEFDRGPERVKVFQKKIVAYSGYFKTNKPLVRYGTDRIRVLTVVEGTGTRLNHLKQLTKRSAEPKRFWFSRLDKVSSEDIFASPIWEVANDSKRTPLIPSSTP